MKGGPTSQLSKELPVSDREASPVSSGINFVLSKEKIMILLFLWSWCLLNQLKLSKMFVKGL